MLKRISLEEDIIFAGGCAYNRFKKLKIPKYPQFLGAMGRTSYIQLKLENFLINFINFSSEEVIFLTFG